MFRWRQLSLSGKNVVGLVLGAVVGLFFGEYCQSLHWLGDLFVRLIQMAILPYIACSLISRVGSLSSSRAATLGLRCGMLLLCFWAIPVVVSLTLPLAFPDWKFAAFYSSALVEEPRAVDVLSIFVPANPFHSLANNIVPAVVLFSVALGIAIIGLEDKLALVNPLRRLCEALERISRFIAGLTPYGVFFITAHAAGTMTFNEFGRVQVFVISFIVGAIVLALFVLPLFVSSITPFQFRDVLEGSRSAIVTAVAADNVFIVLPMITDSARSLFRKRHVANEETDSVIDIMVPVAFSFPNAGRLLRLLFVPFAGWNSGNSLGLDSYPLLSASGVMSFFGSPHVAIPFMLDLFRIPVDQYQLYLVARIVTSRFGEGVAAVSLFGLAVTSACSLTGMIVLRWKGVIRFFTGFALILMSATVVTASVYRNLISPPAEAADRIASMTLINEPVPFSVHRPGQKRLAANSPSANVLADIRSRGVLRVGYHSDNLPFSYFNWEGDLVGFDVDMAHQLAREMRVTLEFVPFEFDTLAGQLNNGEFDVAMSGITITTDRAMEVRFSQPYLDTTAALMVKDYLRRDLRGWSDLSDGGHRVAVPRSYFVARVLRTRLPNAEPEMVASPRDFLNDRRNEVHVMIVTAEAGSAWSLLYPEYSVVVPKPTVRLALAYAVAQDAAELAEFISTWVAMRRGPEFERLYRHWILGETARTAPARWSVIHDVLGWVD